MTAVALGGERRALVIAAVGFGLVLALFVGSRLLAGGDGEEAVEPTAPPTTTPPTTPTPPPGGGTAGEGAEAPVVAIPPVPESLEVLELRDPFTPPLAVVEFVRSLQPEPQPGEPGEPAPPGQPAPTPSDVILREVRLDDGSEEALVEVNEELFEAREGQRFGPNSEFMVVTVDIATQCGTFLFGDESFSLCVSGGAQPPGGPVAQK